MNALSCTILSVVTANLAVLSYRYLRKRRQERALRGILADHKAWRAQRDVYRRERIAEAHRRALQRELDAAAAEHRVPVYGGAR